METFFDSVLLKSSSLGKSSDPDSEPIGVKFLIRSAILSCVLAIVFSAAAIVCCKTLGESATSEGLKGGELGL